MPTIFKVRLHIDIKFYADKNFTQGSFGSKPAPNIKCFSDWEHSERIPCSNFYVVEHPGGGPSSRIF